MSNKTENPLFPIARDKHRERYFQKDFDFLSTNSDNETTFVLGFCDGVSHAAGIWEQKIIELQQIIEQLKTKP